MAEKLPAANLLLLKHLLRLLQHIGHNAATSRMSCSNLAICIGPNLLSPPKEDLLPLEALLEVTEKVRCIEEAAAQPCRPLRAWLRRALCRPSPLSKCWWGGCLQEQPRSQSLLRRGKGEEWERLLGAF